MSERFRKSFVNIIALVCFCCFPKDSIRQSLSIKSQGDSTVDYDAAVSPGAHPSCSDDQSSSLMVKLKGKQKSPDTVLFKMSPLGSSKTLKENGNNSCIFKYSPLSLHKNTTVNETEYSPLIKMNLLPSLKLSDANSDGMEVSSTKGDLPGEILHNHARLIEDNMAPESNGALSAPKPNIVVQKTTEKIELIS